MLCSVVGLAFNVLVTGQRFTTANTVESFRWHKRSHTPSGKESHSLHAKKMNRKSTNCQEQNELTHAFNGKLKIKNVSQIFEKWKCLALFVWAVFRSYCFSDC